MANYLSIVAGITMAVLVAAAKHEQSFCRLQCKQHLSGFLGKSDPLGIKSDYEAFSVEGCFCVSGMRMHKGSPRNPRSLGDKNESLVNTPSNVSETTMTGKQKTRKTKSVPKTTKTTENRLKDEERCNVAEQKKYSFPNMSEPGNVDYESINVSFTKQGESFIAIATWNAPKENSSALIDYLVIWHSKDSLEPFISCREVLKNKTFTVLNKNVGWKYPSALSLTVVSRPRHSLFRKSQGLKSFHPETPEMIPVLPIRNRKASENPKPIPYWSIIIGVFLGVVVFVSLIFIYRRKKRTHAQIPFVIQQRCINNTESKPQNIDTYFASYLPESEDYCNEIATVACQLGQMGYKVVFDQVDSVRMNEIGFNMWVDKQILEAKKCIVFCSPGYVRLWQSLATSATDNKLNHVDKEDIVRVRYEIKWISDVYSENCSTSRIVCIKMDPKMNIKHLPPWMKHNMLSWPEQKVDVIRRLNDQDAMIMNIA